MESPSRGEGGLNFSVSSMGMTVIIRKSYSIRWFSSVSAVVHVPWHACQLQPHTLSLSCVFSSTCLLTCPLLPIMCAHRAFAPDGSSPPHSRVPFLDFFLKHLLFLLFKKWTNGRYVYMPTPAPDSSHVQLNNGNMFMETNC